jgi:hypothetical protein
MGSQLRTPLVKEAKRSPAKNEIPAKTTRVLLNVVFAKFQMLLFCIVL